MSEPNNSAVNDIGLDTALAKEWAATIDNDLLRMTPGQFEITKQRVAAVAAAVEGDKGAEDRKFQKWISSCSNRELEAYQRDPENYDWKNARR